MHTQEIVKVEDNGVVKSSTWLRLGESLALIQWFEIGEFWYDAAG